MVPLKDFLLSQGYVRSKLHLTKTNHFEIIAKINGVKGRFILDTGASSSCIEIDAADTFLLKTQESDIKVTGAGATNMDSMLSKKNTVKIGQWKHNKMMIVLFNLSHVNQGLLYHDSKPVDGIIGADILKKGRAIIDYHKKYLYLKPS